VEWLLGTTAEFSEEESSKKNHPNNKVDLNRNLSLQKQKTNDVPVNIITIEKVNEISQYIVPINEYNALQCRISSVSFHHQLTRIVTSLQLNSNNNVISLSFKFKIVRKEMK
jgi:hypothetical protein